MNSDPASDERTDSPREPPEEPERYDPDLPEVGEDDLAPDEEPLIGDLPGDPEEPWPPQQDPPDDLVIL